MTFLWFSALVGAVFAVLSALVFRRFAEDRVVLKAAPNGTFDDINLLFLNGVLVDADDGLWPYLNAMDTNALEWRDVCRSLQTLLPSFPEDPPVVSGAAPHVSGPAIQSKVSGNTVRVSILPGPELQANWLALQDKAKQLELLEPVLQQSPNPTWCVGRGSQLLWGNRAFEDLANAGQDANSVLSQVDEELRASNGEGAKRIALGTPSTRQDRWYEVSAQDTDQGVLYFATDVDAVVRAEEAQRNFVQTLSKTFANLTTGLAIFDRNRRLALFNPALIDLSSLSAEFLTGRPNLFEFFDKLRDQQVMPEPKNYGNWRECMARLIADASDDRFRETWNLPSGQTFDVTGKPYPDGAIAFLFNDITAEVSLTRCFRTELETMQSSLDVLDDAIAIFSQQGVLTICNAAYKAMWNVDPDTSIIDATILDATQEWKTAFHPAPLWPELRDYVTNAQERASWDSDLRSKDGREVICRVDPICFGATMIRFCHRTPRPASEPGGEPLQIVSA